MELAPSRLLPADLLAVGTVGLSSRRLRASLSAVGVAIGIAAMVAVLGISESSKSDLLSALDRLGTNLLTVSPGQTFFGEDAALPDDAQRMIGRIAPVEQTSTVGTVSAFVYRNELIPEVETKGISVSAVEPTLLETLGGTVSRGRFLDEATERLPTAVLGATTARRLGVDHLGVQIVVGGQRFTVIGVLDTVELAPSLDTAVLVGFPIAAQLLEHDGSVTTVHVRARPDTIEDVRSVLGHTANPEHPDEVDVSRPSDAIEARAAAKSAYTSLFLGLGAVALLVGGVGIANVMVISVLERRSEIGLRRALGATKGHIAVQFVAESLLLAGAGGVIGVALGTAVGAAYASSRGWDTAILPAVLGGGVLVAVLVGAVAGLYPAVRAARLAPSEALRST